MSCEYGRVPGFGACTQADVDNGQACPGCAKVTEGLATVPEAVRIARSVEAQTTGSPMPWRSGLVMATYILDQHAKREAALEGLDGIYEEATAMVRGLATLTGERALRQASAGIAAHEIIAELRAEVESLKGPALMTALRMHVMPAYLDETHVALEANARAVEPAAEMAQASVAATGSAEVETWRTVAIEALGLADGFRRLTLGDPSGLDVHGDTTPADRIAELRAFVMKVPYAGNVP